jgi:hypothetical protein
MAYCKITEDSDVYVAAGLANGEATWEVRLNPDLKGCKFKDSQHSKRTDVRDRLEKLRDAGLKVPKRCLARLEREIFEHEPEHWRGPVR